MQRDHAFQSAHVAVGALFDRLSEAQLRHQIFPQRTDKHPLTVVVGVSGGADSVCLLHALVQFAEQWGLRLHVAHVDHNLRPESAGEAAFVAQLAATLQLPFYTTRLPAGMLYAQAGGLEAAARRARYAFLLRTAINVTPAFQVPCLVLAHQANDQAETVLLNLVRGSGLQGIGGMRWINSLTLHDFVDDPDGEEPTVPDQRVRVVRPLLHVHREEIIAYLKAQKLAWCEDSSNQDTTFVRNQVRHVLLPQLEQINPNLVETLGRTAQILAGEAERLQQLDQQMFAALCLAPLCHPTSKTAEDVPTHRVVLDLEKLLALDVPSQRGVLRQALAVLQPGLHEIGFMQVENLIWQLRARPQAGGPHPLLHQVGWSTTAATAQVGARLSLHDLDTLPFAPEHPYLDEAWQRTIGVLALPWRGQVLASDGWSLHVEEIDRAQLPSDWQQREQPWRAFLDAEQVGAPVLTTPEPGLRFAPLGMQGQHKALGDFFTDRKLPVSLRSGWPLIIDKAAARVLWVCGLAPAHPARITQDTRRVLCLRWVSG